MFTINNCLLIPQVKRRERRRHDTDDEVDGKKLQLQYEPLEFSISRAIV